MISYLYGQTPRINEIQHNGERIGEPTWTIATLYLSLLCVQRRLGHISVKQVITFNYVVLDWYHVASVQMNHQIGYSLWEPDAQDRVVALYSGYDGLGGANDNSNGAPP